MKKTLQLLIVLCISIAICSCHQSGYEKKIVGKWKGTHIEIVDNKLSNKTQVVVDFDENGRTVERDPSTATFPVAVKYRVEGDSIIWMNDKGERTPLNTHIDFLSETTLTYTTTFNGYTGKTDLEKVEK